VVGGAAGAGGTGGTGASIRAGTVGAVKGNPSALRTNRGAGAGESARGAIATIGPGMRVSSMNTADAFRRILETLGL
jgi:hypothetical protein